MTLETGMEPLQQATNMRSTPFLLSLCAYTLAFSFPLFSMPKELKTIAGKTACKTIHEGHMQIQASDRSILHWEEFSIGQKEYVEFLQPSRKSAVLNRVTGKDATQILGQLSSNGRVFLINPNGIVISQDAMIRAGDFIASTLDVLDQDFLLSKELLFKGDSIHGILNYGTIESSDGHILLIARSVDNQGHLLASKGSVSLAAGQEVFLKFEEIPILNIRPSVDGQGILTHAGKIEALIADLQAEGNAHRKGINLTGSVTALNPIEENGRLYLRANTVYLSKEATLNAPESSVHLQADLGLFYQEGAVLADHLSISCAEGPFYQNGSLQGKKVTISAYKFANQGRILADELLIDVKGPYIETVQGKLISNQITIRSEERIFSSGTMKSLGGKISLFAPELVLVSATIDASSPKNGGEIFIGGGAHGEELDASNARVTQIKGDTKLIASATEKGDGGKIVVWSEDVTVCYGLIRAEGGKEGGNGGWIEVSSRDQLYYAADTLATAFKGTVGELFLDPKNITIDAVSGIYPQYQFIDPNSGLGSFFGSRTFPLSTGNVVITKPGDDFAAVGAGAAYLYNGRTAALISTITGSGVNDAVGSSATELTGNGNYVIISPFWSNQGVTTAGAVTWGSGTTGVSGVVSSTNSLVGASAFDTIGIFGVTPLPNGNYVVPSPFWSDGVNASVGAVTWGNGSTGIAGVINSANSLVGSQASDQVGLGGLTILSNDHYVVKSPQWANAGAALSGAVTWCNGSGGTVGVVSSSNSLVGSSAGDLVGVDGVEPLTNGHYVVVSSVWDHGGVTNAGAVTWCDGLGGTVGAVGISNSLVGSFVNDSVGNSGVTVLTNGNYVVSSPNYSGNRGAATWGNGNGGLVGTINPFNSLLGTTVGDSIALSGTIALTNGNYVVPSPLWNNGGTADAGAVTWCDGSAGRIGFVSPINSLVGTTNSDLVGFGGVTALNNGNYVVSSYLWRNGVVLSAGAATWGDGSVGTLGSVSAANSIVGSQSGDRVGIGGVTPLTNGNYVVSSYFWSNAGDANAGAATWGDGSLGTAGVVSAANSLVGTTLNDSIGDGGIFALNNGHYVVVSSSWDNGAVADAGAVTWGDGTSGIIGAVSNANSLVGTSASDEVGSFGIISLTNNNYVVISPNWDDGGTADVGAVTWCNGSGGTTGAVTALNSLVGSTANDAVGNADVTPLSDGNYLVNSSSWDGSSGAVTWSDGTTGSVGIVTIQNSITGQVPSAGLFASVEDTVNGTFLARFLTEGSGRVRVGLLNPNQIAFDVAQSQTMTIAPSFLTNTLDAGTSVSMEANNDIIISTSILASPGAGALSLKAGRNVLINANVTTGNAPFNVTANAPLSSGVVDSERDAGSAILSIANGVTIDTGNADLTLTLADGAGKTNSASGDLTVGDNVVLQCTGSGGMTLTAQQNNIILNNNAQLQTVNGDLFLVAGLSIIAGTNPVTLQTTGSGRLVLISDNLFSQAPFFGTGSVNLPQAILATGGGELLIYTSQRTLNSIPLDINGVAYVPGPEPVFPPNGQTADSVTEKWGVYYPNSSGIPFTIFYKSPVSVPFISWNAVITALQTTIQQLEQKWFKDLFFTWDPYALNTPSLVTQCYRKRKPCKLLTRMIDQEIQDESQKPHQRK